MGDPFGVTASALTVLDAAKEIGKYAVAVYKAEEDRRKLRSLLDTIQGTAKDVKAEVEAASEDEDAQRRVDALDGRKNKNSPLLYLLETLQKMQRKLEAKSKPIDKVWANLTWPLLDKGEIEGFLKDIKLYNDAIMHILDLDTRTDIKDMRKDIKSIKAFSESQLKDQIGKWLSPFEFLAIQKDKGEGAYPTGDRIISSPEFRYWKDGTDGGISILYLIGEAGAGKTFLSYIIIDYLQKVSPKAPVLCLLLDHKSTTPQTARNLLGSLVKQLGIQLRGTGVSDEIRKAWDEANEQNLPARERVLRFLFSSELALHDHVYLVVDAVNECDEEWRILRSWLETLPRDQRKKLRILATSRDTQGQFQFYIDCDTCPNENVTLFYRCTTCLAAENSVIFDICWQCKEEGELCPRGHDHTLELPEEVRMDVRIPQEVLQKYIRDTIEKQMGVVQNNNQGTLETNWTGVSRAGTGPTTKLGDACRKDPKLFQSICEQVAINSNGKFRIASAYLESLRKKKQLNAIKKVINEFASLDDIYADFMNDMIQSAGENRDLALRILGFVVAAKRPLRAEELQHALAVEPGSTIFDRDNVTDQPDILEVTQGFVTINREYHVQCFDNSFHDYLDRTYQQWFPQIRNEFTEACLSYLNLDIFSTPCGPLEDFLERQEMYPFISYVAQRWGDHVREAGSAFEDATSKYLQQPPRVATYIQAAWWTSGYGATKWDVRRDVHPLHICAWFGLTNLLPKLDPNNADINVIEKTYGQTPLMYACRRRQVDSVKALLAQNADVNVVSGRGRTALMEAILPKDSIRQKDIEKDNEIVRILLERELLDINHSNTKELGRSALHLAVRQGNKAMVDAILSRHDVEVNKIDSQGNTALIIASSRGYISIVDSLLKITGIKLNGANNGRKTALILASEAGYVEVVKQLMAKGADTQIQDHQQRTAAFHACQRGHLDVLKLLDEFHTNLAALDQDQRSLLHAASSFGSMRIINLLISRGLDVNARDTNGLTPLHEACRSAPNEEYCTVDTLLDLGADSSLLDNFSRTPFTIAWQYGKSIFMTILQIKGTNKTHDAAQSTTPSLDLPLWSLILQKQTILVQTAFESGTPIIDPTIPEPCTDYTTLHCAIIAETMDDTMYKKMEILNLLLKHGKPSIGIADKNKQTPIHLAVIYHSDNAILALLQALKDNPLLYPFSEEIINAKDIYGQTALYLSDRISASAAAAARTSTSQIAFSEGATTNKPSTTARISIALIEADANLDSETNNIDTQRLFLEAVQLDSLDAAAKLYQAGADPLAQDEYGRTAMSFAQERARKSGVETQMLKFLQQTRSLRIPVRGPVELGGVVGGEASEQSPPEVTLEEEIEDLYDVD